jgi:prepilin-type N-terminal cleavage/methylation domain-containing protein
MRLRLRRNEAGFTLVEVLTVVVVLGVLVSIAVGSFLGFRDRAADRTSQAVLREALPSLTAYATDHDGSFAGATSSILRGTYDSGLGGVEVDAADHDSFCLRSTVNDHVWYGAGPPLTLSRATCA